MVKSLWDRQSQGLAFTRSFKDHHLLLWGPPPVSMWTTEGRGMGSGLDAVEGPNFEFKSAGPRGRVL